MQPVVAGNEAPNAACLFEAYQLCVGAARRLDILIVSTIVTKARRRLVRRAEDSVLLFMTIAQVARFVLGRVRG